MVDDTKLKEAKKQFLAGMGNSRLERSDDGFQITIKSESRRSPLLNRLKGLGLKMADVASVIDISPSRLSQCLNGHTDFPQDVERQVVAICEMAEHGGK